MEDQRDQLTDRTVRPPLTLVNTLLQVETRGSRLRHFLMERMGSRHGWVVKLAAESGVTRQTLSSWFGGRTEPDLAALRAIAEKLPGTVRVFEIVAAMEGEEPAVALDAQTREALRAEIEAVLDERLGPRREGRGRAGAA